MTRWAAVVLAGGRSRRFGRDKTRAVVGSGSLLSAAVGAVPPEMPCVIVGPVQPLPERTGLVWALEEQRFSGPVGALKAGLVALPARTDGVLLLAGDLPFAGPAVRVLISTWEDGAAEAVVAVDESGQVQPLLALYALEPLRRSLAASSDQASMRSLLAGLRVRRCQVPAGSTFDVDTLDDLRAAHGVEPGEPGAGGP